MGGAKIRLTPPRSAFLTQRGELRSIAVSDSAGSSLQDLQSVLRQSLLALRGAT